MSTCSSLIRMTSRRLTLSELRRSGCLDAINTELEAMSAADRVSWALSTLPTQLIMTSSFGAQSAVLLHLMTRQWPDIPVVFLDTGYLFPETYAFADELTDRLGLNLHVYQSSISNAWQEARHGQQWQEGESGLKAYNRINKVEPMQRALRELEAGTWFSGLRRQQADSRQDLDVISIRGEQIKVHPLIDWTNQAIHQYLKQHDLPYHPLWEKGYVSIGDTHSTRPITDVEDLSGTRHHGLFRECGIHEIGS